jgi:hypothetical protein
MKNNILYLWQLPQHLLALIFLKIWKIEEIQFYKHCKVYWIKKKGVGISLGNYIFLDEKYTDTTVSHEYGHSIQSLIFGPLYLIIIGIPSAIFNNLYDRVFHKKWEKKKRIKWYYNRFPEKWADKLGNVKRINYETE